MGPQGNGRPDPKTLNPKPYARLVGLIEFWQGSFYMTGFARI